MLLQQESVTISGKRESLGRNDLTTDSVSSSVVSDSLQISWTVARQVPLSMEFSRQEYWNGLPFPSPGDLPDSRTEPGSPALQAGSLLSELPGKPQNSIQNLKPNHVVNCII